MLIDLISRPDDTLVQLNPDFFTGAEMDAIGHIMGGVDAWIVVRLSS